MNNIMNPNTVKMYFNSANPQGVFAQIYAPADLMITFLTQESRYNNQQGMSYETFFVYHNDAMYNEFTEESVIIFKQTNNLKDLDLWIRKNSKTGKFYLCTSKFSGVAYITYVGQGEYSDCVRYVLPEEVPEDTHSDDTNSSNGNSDYRIVVSPKYNVYRCGADAQFKNIEEGTIVYDFDAHNIKFPRWGMSFYEADGGWWFYPEEEHVRKMMEADSVLLLSSIGNGTKHTIMLSAGNIWSVPKMAVLEISCRALYGASTTYEVTALCNNPTGDEADLNIEIVRVGNNLYLHFLAETYIVSERAYTVTSDDIEAGETISVYYTSGDTAKRLNIPSAILGHYPGMAFYDTTLHKPLWWNGSRWSDSNNEAAVAHSGTTGARPDSTDLTIGFQYFDTTLNKPIWWAGMNWVDATGMTV